MDIVVTWSSCITWLTVLLWKCELNAVVLDTTRPWNICMKYLGSGMVYPTYTNLSVMTSLSATGIGSCQFFLLCCMRWAITSKISWNRSGLMQKRCMESPMHSTSLPQTRLRIPHDYACGSAVREPINVLVPWSISSLSPKRSNRANAFFLSTSVKSSPRQKQLKPNHAIS